MLTRRVAASQIHPGGLYTLAAIVIYWRTAHRGEAARQRKHAGLTVEPELLAHMPLASEYQIDAI